MTQMKRKILLVDDEQDFLSVIRARLSKAGFRVICAHNGKEALAKLKTHKPLVIVTDVMMPVMDGVDFFQRLKADGNTRDIPVIVSTVKDQLEESFRAVGAAEFIAKPFEAGELVERIEKVLSTQGT